MTLVFFRFVCDACGHAFEAPETSSDYGEFVMRGEIRPEPALLVALVDPVYDEVDRILRDLGAYDGMHEDGAADLLQELFGLACDPSPDGTLLEVGRPAPCPDCGSREMRSWAPVYPPREYTGVVLPVSHRRWNALAPHEKQEILRAAALSRAT